MLIGNKCGVKVGGGGGLSHVSCIAYEGWREGGGGGLWRKAFVIEAGSLMI